MATNVKGDVARDAAQILGAAVSLTAIETTHKGHARTLAERALQDQLDFVATLGGDGTANEAANGLLSHGAADQTPALAVVPGGQANVLARSLDLTDDPQTATQRILAALRQGRTREISLGHADLDDREQWFIQSLAVGMAARIMKSVEDQRSLGSKPSYTRYFSAAVRETLRETRQGTPTIRITDGTGQKPDPAHLVIVQNNAPLSFLGPLPVNPSPLANFDGGLDIFAVQRLGPVRMLRWGRRMLMGSKAGSAPGLLIQRDESSLTLEADELTPVQLDGDYVGQHRHIHITNEPQALRVVC